MPDGHALAFLLFAVVAGVGMLVLPVMARRGASPGAPSLGPEAILDQARSRSQSLTR